MKRIRNSAWDWNESLNFTEIKVESVENKRNFLSNEWRGNPKRTTEKTKLKLSEILAFWSIDELIDNLYEDIFVNRTKVQLNDHRFKRIYKILSSCEISWESEDKLISLFRSLVWLNKDSQDAKYHYQNIRLIEDSISKKILGLPSIFKLLL